MAANDAWASATTLAGTSGTDSGDFYGATQETSEPALDPSADPAVGTLWYVYAPSSPGTFNFTIESTDAGIEPDVELLIGDDISTLVQQDVGVGSTYSAAVSAAVASGVPVYIRIYPQTVVPTTALYHVTWSFVSQPNQLAVTLVSDCAVAPGIVVVHVGNVAPGDNVYFTIDNASFPALIEAVAPDDGVGESVGNIFYVPREEQILFVGVLVSDGHDKGIHTLNVTSDLSGSAIIDFHVLASSLDIEQEPGADGFLSTLPTTTKWIFADPAPGGEVYVFEESPLTMTSPFPDKVVTIGYATAPDGQTIEWEGTQKAVSWQLSGTLRTQTQLEAFQRFAALDHRVWIVDHFKRAWVVTLEELDAEPRSGRGTGQYPYIHDWKMTLFIWEGPVDVS